MKQLLTLLYFSILFYTPVYPQAYEIDAPTYPDYYGNQIDPIIKKDFYAKIHFDTRIDSDITVDHQVKVAKLLSYVDKDPQIIRIYLNTNGGRVDVGLDYVAAIVLLKSKGHTVNCVVDKAISAGFLILSQCTNRFGWRDSVLLHHNPWFWYTGPINLPIIESFKEGLSELGTTLDSIVSGTFKPNKSIFEYLRDNDVPFNPVLANHWSPGFFKEVWRTKNER